MTTLVTGGFGAVGSFVTRILVERGESALVYDLRPDPRLVRDILTQVTVFQGDILDLAQLVDTFGSHRVKRVIHTAALMPEPARERPFLGTQVNVVGLSNVLEAARLTGVRRVVFASTKGVYAEIEGIHDHPTYAPINERYPKDPNSLYDASRFYGERLGLAYMERYSLEFCATRFAHTYGPGKLTHGTLAVPSQIVEGAYRGHPVRIPQGGEAMDDMVYNRDSALGLVCAAFAPNPRSRVYQIASGRPSSLHDVAAATRKLFPDAHIEIGPGLDFKGIGRKSCCVFDITRARTEIGYEPQFSLEQGVADYVALLDKVDYFGIGPRLATAPPP
jgi:UDP-glucose 4-epimerase